MLKKTAVAVLTLGYVLSPMQALAETENEQLPLEQKISTEQQKQSKQGNQLLPEQKKQEQEIST
ncbi:hypothetical protein, partial [Bacillus pseudomycoides]